MRVPGRRIDNEGNHHAPHGGHGGKFFAQTLTHVREPE
jgi:hypothetical protein